MDVLAVSDLVSYIRRTLESDPLLTDIWVEGETSNVFRSGNGHLYFSIKDAGATMRCVMFRGRGRAATFDNGEQVVVHGSISMYEPRGELQLVANLVQPAGLGELQLQFEALRARLETEGLFDPARKRPLPLFPQRIGLVTSAGGAVLHDMFTVMSRRYPLVELVLSPCLVQGESAPAEIARAIDAINQIADIDLIIVARGGGSAEDLAAFNSEIVARAIFASVIPVVSAVGHETDVTIADFVADLRAPTPSAAAELTVPDVEDLLMQIGQSRAAIIGAAGSKVSELAGALRFTRLRLNRAVPDLARTHAEVEDLGRRLVDRVTAGLALDSERLNGLARRLSVLDPRGTLARGYAVVENAGRPVRGAGDLSAGDAVRVTMYGGAWTGTVKHVERDGQSAATGSPGLSAGAKE